MLIVGLTGSIGMGKSATSEMFRKAGIPVFDADAAVHEIYRREPVPAFRNAFAASVVNDRIDRARLSAILLDQPSLMQQLEEIIHPLVALARTTFLQKQTASNRSVCVFDIPLLLEKGGAGAVDVVAVVSAPSDIQEARVLDRAGMTREKFDMIRKHQLPDVDKRRQAHFVIDSSRGFDYARRQVASLLRAVAPN